MRRYIRLICAVLLVAVLVMSFGIFALASDGVDTPIIEYPFDDPVDDTPEPLPEDDGMPGWAIALIIVGSILVVAVLCFFANWFFIMKRDFSDLKALFSKKPKVKRKRK